MEEIRILQLGEEDWNRIYELPSWIHLDYQESFCEPPWKPYDMFFLDRPPLEEEIEPLYRAAKAYTLFVTEKGWDRAGAGSGADSSISWLYRSRKAKPIKTADIQQFLKQEARFYYPRPYGEKFNPKDLSISHEFKGKIKWDGNYRVNLEGDFGKKLCQAAFWKSFIPIFQGQVLNFWLEYHKSPSIMLFLTVTKFARGSISHILEQWKFDERELADVIQDRKSVV